MRAPPCLLTFDDIEKYAVLNVVGWGTGVVPRVCWSRLLDHQTGDRVGVETGVGDLDVVLVVVVDDLGPLVPVDVGGGPGALHYPALESDRRSFLDVEILVPDYQGPGLWNVAWLGVTDPSFRLYIKR